MRHLAPILVLAIGCGEAADSRDAALAYGPAQTFAAGEHPVTLAIIDTDRDGDLDVLVPGLVTATMTVLENDSGALRALDPVPLAAGVLSAAGADLDGDGVDELVTSMPAAGELGAWHLVDGALVAVARARRERPSAVAAGDADGDGRAEIALAEAGAVSLFERDGTDLRVLASFEAPEWPTSVVLTELDGDGALDLAVTGARPGELWIPGDGEPPRVAIGTFPMGLIAADVDTDPEVELLGADNLGDALVIAEMVAGQPSTRLLPAPGQPAAIAAGDLDGDGAVDLAVAAKGADRVDLWLGDGTGHFTLATTLPAGFGPSALAVPDLDGDGCLDLVIVNAFSSDVTTYRCQPPARRGLSDLR